MDVPPTYLGLDLVQARPLTRLERLEFETRRDQSRRIVRRRWRRWGLILVGFAAYIAATGFLNLNGAWMNAPMQIGLPLLLAYEAAHRGLARGEGDEAVAVYRGVRDDAFKAYWARTRVQTGLPKRPAGDSVELAVLLPSGRLWSVDGFRVRGVPVPLTKRPAHPPEGDEDGRSLSAGESSELRSWARLKADAGQKMAFLSAMILLLGGGACFYFESGPWPYLFVVLFASGIAALGLPAWREATRIRRTLAAPRLRTLVASPDGRSPAVPMAVVEGTGLPWTVKGHPAPWRYGGQPKRVKESLPVRRDPDSVD